MANISIPNPFQRNDAFPLDATVVFSTYIQLTAYAANAGNSQYPGIMYPGQICAVSGTPTTAYIINSDFSVSALALNNTIYSVTGTFVKYTDINTLTGNWQSTYTTVSSNSSNWNTAYTLATGLTGLSSNWQSTYTTVAANSSSWGTGGGGGILQLNGNSISYVGDGTTYAYSITSLALSSNNPNNFLTTLNGVIQQPSIDYTVSGANLTFTSTPYIGDKILIISNYATATNTISASNITTNTLNAYTIYTNSGNSNNWNNAYVLATGLTSLSSNWQSVYTTVCSFSAGWGTGGTAANLGQIPVLSANWNTAYTLATGLTSLSSNWQTAYQNVSANNLYLNSNTTSLSAPNAVVSISSINATGSIFGSYLININTLSAAPNNTYTLSLSDNGTHLTITNNISSLIIIPSQANTPWPAGSNVIIEQNYNAGTVQLSASPGVILYSSSTLFTRTSSSVIAVVRKSQDTWLMYGDTR